MQKIFYVLCAMLAPYDLIAEPNAPLIRNDEFSKVTVREQVACSTAWHALRIIELLGSFEAARFGANHVLKNIAEQGCEEFAIDLVYKDSYGTAYDERRLIGVSSNNVIQSAKALMSQPGLMNAQETAGDGTKELCARATLRYPDDLGMLLYHLIAETPEQHSPLYSKYEEKVVRCRNDVWEEAFQDFD